MLSDKKWFSRRRIQLTKNIISFFAHYIKARTKKKGGKHRIILHRIELNKGEKLKRSTKRVSKNFESTHQKKKKIRKNSFKNRDTIKLSIVTLRFNGKSCCFVRIARKNKKKQAIRERRNRHRGPHCIQEA